MTVIVKTCEGQTKHSSFSICRDVPLQTHGIVHTLCEHNTTSFPPPRRPHTHPPLLSYKSTVAEFRVTCTQSVAYRVPPTFCSPASLTCASLPPLPSPTSTSTYNPDFRSISLLSPSSASRVLDW